MTPQANEIIQKDGIPALVSLFLRFYNPNSFFFSSFKNLLLEVFISLAQWHAAALKMIEPLIQDHFDEIYEAPGATGGEAEKKKEKTKEK